MNGGQDFHQCSIHLAEQGFRFGVELGGKHQAGDRDRQTTSGCQQRHVDAFGQQLGLAQAGLAGRMKGHDHTDDRSQQANQRSDAADRTEWTNLRSNLSHFSRGSIFKRFFYIGQRRTESLHACIDNNCQRRLGAFIRRLE